MLVGACDPPDDGGAIDPRAGGGGKALVCHETGAGEVVAINVSVNALEAHLDHGDVLAEPDGTCSPCDGMPEGAMYCADDGGFFTCEDGEAVHRACAPGTECRPFEGSILCDWPL